MKSKLVRKLAAFSLTLATLFLIGCGQSEQEREAERQAAISQGLDTANRLLFSRQTDQALSQLETLDQKYPNNPDILEALAFAYAKKPDPALAAFYFDTVVQLDPSRSDLALYAASAHKETGDNAAAIRAYEIYLADSEEDAAAWRELAKALQAERRTKPALNAWLTSLKLSGSQPNATEAVGIGRLYLNLDNLPQARRWLDGALKANPDKATQANAILGLLELDLREQQWVAAEKRIVTLDQVDPKALDGSPLAPARLELRQWREAQKALEQQGLTPLTEADTPEAEAASPETPEQATEAETAVAQADEATDEGADANAGTITIDPTGETINVASTDEDSLAPDVDKSNRLPGPPAHRQEERAPMAADGSDSEAVATADSDDLSRDAEVAPTPLADEVEVEVAETPLQPSLLERADLAYEAGNYQEAIQLYQTALAEEPNAAPIYYGLSRCFFNTQQWPQAELYASEAMRLSPTDLRYTVNFLRTIQRSQNSDRLMAEMIKARERFPTSPDITLALARGYERLYNNRRNAIFLYQEFLNLAPGHPQAEDVRAHLETLR